MVKRRLYKPDRAPARTKGVIGRNAPVSCPDADRFEIASAVFAICKEAGFIIGRGAEYDQLKDEYTLIGKSLESGKAQEVKLAGFEVGAVIKMFRNARLYQDMAPVTV